MNILILGASYGSLLGTKLAMAGHDVTLTCREKTAALINTEGTYVRIRLRGEDEHRTFHSGDMPGKVTAATPAEVDPSGFDLACLAMQEPQYGEASVRALLAGIAQARVPAMSIMNMPPQPYLARIPGLEAPALASAFTDPDVWAAFDPSLVTLCSPDPQAYRPPEEAANVLHVGLPTNFKVAAFGDERLDKMLATLEADIAALRVDGQDVPVKLRLHDSPFVPFAKWSMLLAGNYRCVTSGEPRSIRDAVHSDPDAARNVYGFVDELVRKLGADASDLVPFEKYAKAAEGLGNPSSVARAIAGGATKVERVDRLVQLVARQMKMQHDGVDATVALVDAKLKENAA